MTIRKMPTATAVVILLLTMASMKVVHPDVTLVSKNQFNEILEALVITNDFGTNVEIPDGWLEKRNRAIVQLHTLGTNALPFLLDEIDYIAALEKTNRIASVGPKTQTEFAFRAVGVQAQGLIPQLIARLDSGCDPGNTAQALADIGGDSAGLALVNALTNSIIDVRIAAASSIAFFKNNQNVAEAAVTPLLRCLNDGSPTLRGVAINALGILEKSPGIVIPALIRTAHFDPEFVLRASAIQSIGLFGTNAIWTESELQRLSESDGNETVRRTAKRILRSLTR